MRRLSAAILLLTFLAGSASACSFAEQPPSPGAFFIWDWTTGNETRIDVHGRTLSAMCGLSNPHDLEGDRFAWIETTHERAADGSGRMERTDTLRVANLTTGETHNYTVPATRHDDLALAGDRLVHLSRDPASGETRAYVLNLTTGEETVLGVARSADHHVFLAGPRVVLLDHENTGTRLYLYDARTDEWVLKGRALSEFAADARPHLRAGGENWLLLDSRDGDRAYHVPTDEMHPHPRHHEFHYMTAVDGDALYGVKPMQDGNRSVRVLHRLPLPGEPAGSPARGTAEPLAELPHGFLGTVDGTRVVLGAYSAPDHNATVHEVNNTKPYGPIRLNVTDGGDGNVSEPDGERPDPDADNATDEIADGPYRAPGPGLVALLVALALAARARRR